MIKNYLLIAYRNFLRNKKYFLINVLGFSFGITACLLIFTFIYTETSTYDRSFSDSKSIYRVVSTAMQEGNETRYPYTIGNLGTMAQEKLSGITSFFRVHHYGNLELKYKDYKSSALNIQYVDSTFFDILDYPVETAGAQVDLLSPFSVLLSQQTANKIFGSADPYLEIVEIDGLNYTVKGVIDTKKCQSHFQFDILASMSSLIRPDYNIIELEGIHFPTYFKLQDGVTIDDITPQLNIINDEAVNEKFGQFGFDVNVYLQALDKVHLHSDFSVDYAKTTNINFIYLFTALAIFILIIAIINFINLSIAIYHKRIKEVGLRKVIGAKRKDLIVQFVTESVLITFVAFILSLIFVETLSNPFRNIMQSDIQLIYYQSPVMLLYLFLSVVLIGIFSGIYPAYYLSGLKITVSLKGINRIKKFNLRKALVVFQFAISVFIIIVLLLLASQMRYVKNKNFHFDTSNVLVLSNLSEKLISDYVTVKTELMKTPGVVYITASSSTPGVNRISNDYVHISGKDPNSGILFNINNIHYDYTNTYGITFNEGRDFSQEYTTDKNAYIINEAATRKMGLNDPIGTLIHVRGQDGEIIGVVHDFHFRSLHSPIQPLLLYMRHPYFNYISIKLESYDPLVIENIKHKLSEIDPGYDFDYFFIDETLKNLYKEEDRVFELFSYAAFLAIIISLMGLFALTLFTMQDNMKSIGIRKVLGSTNKAIVNGLLNDIVRWVFIANIIAWPVAFYFMKNWLQKFAYGINLYAYWWCFVIAGLATLILSIVVILNQAVKAANTNPVEILKYE